MTSPASASVAPNVTRVNGGSAESTWDLLGTGGQIGVIIACVAGFIGLVFGLAFVHILIQLCQRRRTGSDWLSDLENRDKDHMTERRDTNRWLLGLRYRIDSDNLSPPKSDLFSSDTGSEDMIYALPASPPPLAKPRSAGDLRRSSDITPPRALRKPRSDQELRYASADTYQGFNQLLVSMGPPSRRPASIANC